MKEKVFTRHGKLKRLAGCQKDAKYWMADNSDIRVSEVRIVLACKSERAREPNRPGRMLRTEPLCWLPDPNWSKGSLEWVGGVGGLEGCPNEISSWVAEHPDIKIEMVKLRVFYNGEDNREKPGRRRMLRV